MDLVGDLASGIMTPLYYGITALLLAGHWAFALILPADSGWTWVLAIVGLTVAVRVLIFPLSYQTIKSKRAMQALQPRIKELQKQYGGDRKRLSEEQRRLWSESGTNPFGSCLPLLLELPIFFALFRVIDLAAQMGADGGARGFLSTADAESLQEAVFLGSRVGDTLMTFEPVAFAESSSTRIIALALIAVMCATQFYAQWRLLYADAVSSAVDDDPYRQQQMFLLYALPFVFAVGGLAFPLGVLVHWTTWNVWTLAEQSYVMRNDPGLGSSGGMVA
jgi:YidC/Oxa1 family membrane protein insertase